MQKDKLYATKRYLLIVVLTCFFIVIGASLQKTWNMTPETHFYQAISLLQEKQSYKAIHHFILANKSQNSTIRALSAYQLAKLYSKGTESVSSDMKKARFYYEQAAAMNIPEAQYELALLYDVGNKIPENRKKAIEQMIKASKILPKAKYALAVWIERGYLGTPNQKKAVELYEQAADSGVINAMKSLISIYHGGYGLFPKNIEKEQYWRHRLEAESKKK